MGIKKDLVILGIIVALSAVVSIYFFSDKSVVNSEKVLEEEIIVQPAEREILSTRSVQISPVGFFPEVLEIVQGESVTFVNKGSGVHWPATEIHPSHSVYPGSSIAKCGLNSESRIFDACRGLNRGESYSFKFDKIGTWRYHDHLNPGLKGVIVVQ
jgi:plastocyanin